MSFDCYILYDWLLMLYKFLMLNKFIEVIVLKIILKQQSACRLLELTFHC